MNIELRKMTIGDTKDTDFVNWSRPYEYGYVLDELKDEDIGSTVHNTACGNEPIHLLFQEKLNDLGLKVTNSDAFIKDENSGRIVKYDIREKCDNKYDVVLCISTLEHLCRDEREKAFLNLLDSTKKRLIITMDCPDVSVSEVINWIYFLKQKKRILLVDVEDEQLNTHNSIFQAPELGMKTIILLDITL